MKTRTKTPKKSLGSSRSLWVLKSLIEDGVISLSEVMDNNAKHGKSYAEESLKSLVTSGRVTIEELLNRVS